MRKSYFTALFAIFACLASAYAQQKQYGWVPDNSNTFRMMPGAYNGIAVFNPHGWEAMHIRLDIDARDPVMIGVVPLDDWNKAVQDRELLHNLNYACLTQGVTRLNFSCDFYASYTSRVVVVRDMRYWEHRGHRERSGDRDGDGDDDHPVVSGIGVPLAHMAFNEYFGNDVHVTPYHWGCTAYCNLPDPPQFGWVDLRREKFQITPEMKSYGPFTPEKNNVKIRIYVKTPYPMTVAVVPSATVDDLYAHRDNAREILSKTACKEYGVQKTSFDCTLQMSDGPQQVVLLPEVEIRKKKKAHIEISTVRCIANCVP
ncbi:MAG: hypothetical protein ACM3SW_13910 [Actinomycetota bacterium]